MDYYESIHEEAPKEIVVMKNIAEAIQLCDMNAFDQFLKKLRKVVKDSNRGRISLVFSGSRLKMIMEIF